MLKFVSKMNSLNGFILKEISTAIFLATDLRLQLLILNTFISSCSQKLNVCNTPPRTKYTP